VTPTPRAALLLAALALAALLVSPLLALLAILALAAATVVDALTVRRRPEIARSAPEVVARGVPAKFRLRPGRPVLGPIRLRQPLPPDLELRPASEGDGEVVAELVGIRRGRHPLPRPAVRVAGPLGLGAWFHRAGGEAEVRVYPDLPGARRLALAVRQGHFREEARRTRGPLGLGTEFESVRDYSPDDDIRQVNWRATARLGRPMSNQYRIERDRDVVCVVDCGRLLAAPLADGTRLDAGVDAAVAVAAVADILGDRCGTIAFDAQVRRSLAPRRAGARAVVEALYDLEPEPVDSDYERAFREVGAAKRAFVLVVTDLLEEAAARSLLDALPVVARRHAVAVASAADPDLTELLRRDPARPLDVYRAAVAVEVLDARARVAAQLRHGGVDVVEAPPERFSAACVTAYLRAKSRARL
jgi:uncharacterized protein (DUF58 family)